MLARRPSWVVNEGRMSILVFGEKAGRTHENQMLQAFLETLEDRWATSDQWIVVIANAMWNGAEIDLVCVVSGGILVADFKSHGGKLVGTENGPWQADGVLVKGGRKDNPYQQLRDNKFAVLDWLKSKSLLGGRNLGHISAGAIFSGRIVDQLELPSRVRSWFFPTDLDSCATLLNGLASPELRIDRSEALEIIQRLGAQQIEWKTTRPTVRTVDPCQPRPQGRAPLTAHQRDALQTITLFVNSDDWTTFSVTGMTSTGKSRLLVEAIAEIERAGRQAIVLEPNRRLADQSDVEARSIYSHIYTGNADEQAGVDSDVDTKRLKIIPLRECDDAENCVYVLDDAHLLGNSRFTTPDGKQYGSGQLLDDFLEFTELGTGKRKALFLGDPYQIQRASEGESILLGDFQSSRKLKHKSIELNQIIDATGGSARIQNAERLVSAIRHAKFASFELAVDENFRTADKKQAAIELYESFQSDPSAVWYLAETHSKVNDFNRWMRERLHRKQHLLPVEPGDLLEIYIGPDNRDPLGARLPVKLGGRQVVNSVGDRAEYLQGLSWVKGGPVRFHSIRCVLGDQHECEALLFEEFLVAEKPELTREVAIAESVWRRQFEDAREGVQPELPGVDAAQHLPAVPNFSYARYGYASTVHHAQGMSIPICYVNCDHGAGRHSEGYFRWLYSALTVADREIVLVNFTGINPFDEAVWNRGAVPEGADLPIGAGWSFQSNGIASEKDQSRDLPHGLEQSKDLLKSISIWLRITNAAEKFGWRVVKATCHPYQEKYEMASEKYGRCHLRVAYNAKNVVTSLHVDDSAYWNLLSNVASECIEGNSFTPEAGVLLRWARTRLAKEGWKILSAAETAYRLSVTVGREPCERVALEFNFDKQGLVTSVRPMNTSNSTLPELIRSVLV